GDVDLLVRQEIADELTMTVVADLANNGRAHLQPSQPGADVAGEAAHVADEVALLAQRRADLRRIHVGAQPAEDYGLAGYDFFQSISHSWSGSVVKSHSRTAPAIAFR